MTVPASVYARLLAGMLIPFCLSGIGLLFWYEDVQYTRPTPKPKDLLQKPVGSLLRTGQIFQGTGRPLLLHFFNPACPCSRFNRKHLRELFAQFKSEVDMVVVLEATDSLNAIEAYANTGIPIAYVVDTEGKIAEQCGVYATPQAVVLSGDSRLYYRGNYNTSRYCVNRQTQFARLALQALLAGKPRPAFLESGATSYGCRLPADEDREANLFFSFTNF